jgi:hypothetical protein
MGISAFSEMIKMSTMFIWFGYIGGTAIGFFTGGNKVVTGVIIYGSFIAGIAFYLIKSKSFGANAKQEKASTPNAPITLLVTAILVLGLNIIPAAIIGNNYIKNAAEKAGMSVSQYKEAEITRKKTEAAQASSEREDARNFAESVAADLKANEGVVVYETAKMYSAKIGVDSNLLLTLKRGDKVTITGQSDGRWIAVRVNGQSGFMRDGDLYHK